MKATRGIALALVLVAAEARAQEPTPERIAAAAEEFEQGRRAYLQKDFAEAAVHFENAFHDAPRAETLRLAIRARREAKQLSRAATLAALALQKYDDEATTKYANETIEAAKPEVQEVLVECRTPCTLTADGRIVASEPAARHRLFLDPGRHDLGVGFGAEGSVTRSLEAQKGAAETLVFAPEKRATPPIDTKPPPEQPRTKPFGPAVFFVAAGVTAALGAVTIASGIDTTNDPGVDTVRRECAGRDESCPAYQEGQDKELRTNVLLGATAGALLVTGVIGLFFTQWSSPKVTAKGLAITF